MRDKVAKNRINHIRIARVGVETVLVRAIAYDVVEVPEGIEIRIQIEKRPNLPKVVRIGFFLTFSLKKRRIIRILSADKVHGTDYEVKWMVVDKIMKIRCMRPLHSEFDPDSDADLAAVPLLQPVNLRKIGIQIKGEIGSFRRTVQIKMFGEAHAIKSKGNRALDHRSGSGIRIGGKRGVQMKIMADRHKIIPFFWGQDRRRSAICAAAVLIQ